MADNVTLSMDHAVGRSVDVRSGDNPLFTYVYRPDTAPVESPKPYLHPIHTLAGDLVTVFRPHDHVWHKGIAWSLPHVGEHNFWGGPTYVHGSSYVQLPNNGRAAHQEMTTLSVDPGRAALAHRLNWTSQGGLQVIDERRSISATVVDGTSWVMVFETAMTNVSGAALSFGSPTTKGRENAGYGGLFWRGPRSFTGGVVQSPDGVASADELRGTRAPWLAFRGRHDESGRSSTIVMVDDTTNSQHPTQWFTRSTEFACLCPAPFFSEELLVEAEETIAFRYAIVIASGDFGDEGTGSLADHGRRALGVSAADAPVSGVAA